MNHRRIATVQMYKTKHEIKSCEGTALEKLWCGPRFVVTKDSPFEGLFNWALHLHTNIVE